jgi:hypothetical protein
MHKINSKILFLFPILFNYIIKSLNNLFEKYYYAVDLILYNKMKLDRKYKKMYVSVILKISVI